MWFEPGISVWICDAVLAEEMAVQVPVQVGFDGNSSIAFEPDSVSGGDAAFMNMACNIKIPLAALVDALVEFQKQHEAAQEAVK